MSIKSSRCAHAAYLEGVLSPHTLLDKITVWHCTRRPPHLYSGNRGPAWSLVCRLTHTHGQNPLKVEKRILTQLKGVHLPGRTGAPQ